MIISPLGFFEVQVKGGFWQAFELCEPHLRHPPEAFDAVDMDAPAGEFVLGVIDAKVTIAKLDQTVVTAPSIRVNHRTNIHFSTNYPL